MDEMLTALTKGIGADLGKKIRLKYYDMKRFVVNSEVLKGLNKKFLISALDLLALSIFHEYVIGPLHGSNNFYTQTMQYGVKSINMGSYKFDDELNAKTENITKAFFAIMSNYDIEMHQLSIPSINEFLLNNIRHIENWQE